jgi:acyl-CoA thioester hydrolase
VARPYVYETRIRFVDTDASGRIHYTSMFRHFEAAEQEFLRDAGCPFTSPELETYSFPRVHVECDYRSELRYDDLIQIAMDVERIGRSSYTLRFQVSCEGREAAAGRIVVVCIDKREKKATAIPTPFESILRGLLDA